MLSKGLFRLFLFLLSLGLLSASQFPGQTDLKPKGSVLTGYGSPQNSFTAQGGCGLQNGKETTTGSSPPKLFASSLKLHLRPRLKMKHEEMISQSTVRDRNRIRTFNSNRRLTESIKQQQKKKKNETPGEKLQHRSRHLLDHQRKTNPSSISENKSAADSSLHIQVMATLKSGVSLGSGEYFMDVFIGTPPKKFQLIVDTGSDLTWIQCLPCHDCFNQTGPFYNPNDSTSFRPVPCHDPRCRLVTPPDTESSSSSSSSSRPCKSTTTNCHYFYWYGDSSNTTGDFALETFTLNLTNRSPQGNNLYKRVEDVMFGCGHWNRGLFHGAAGLIGLGQGPLSFSTQLQSLYGRSFSYCLVGWNSDPETTSKLIFGDEEEYSVPNPKLMNFTAISVRKEVESIDQTFYYVQIKSIVVGGEVVDIPEERWRREKKDGGGGGAIVDSGTTLSYFLEPMYRVIKDAFVKRVRGYSRVEDFLVLSPCYNVSGAAVEELDQFPSFGIKFSDGTEWNFPVMNYFLLVGEDVVCLAMLGTPSSSDFSIIGNYLQQNFHVSYDLKRSRLGFAPAKCGDV